METIELGDGLLSIHNYVRVLKLRICTYLGTHREDIGYLYTTT